jgi:hypothetical protein
MNSRYFWRKIIISNKLLNNGLFLSWRVFHYKEKKKIAKRSKLSIENIDILSKPLKRCPSDNVLDNSFYGISASLKLYSNYSKKINYFIEHGIYFGSVIHQFERDYYLRNIITPSLVRKEHIETKTMKKVLTVGPYIHYAKEYLDEASFIRLKEQLGKVLLVFPSHSTAKINAEFDLKLLFSKIEQLKRDFDTIIICLYWKDIVMGHEREYLKNGYKVVTAGHMFDDNFLSRLRLMIKLSDVTVSNSLGTHLGYSIYLGKPHTIFKQKIIHDTSDKKYLKYDRSIFNEETWNSFITEKRDVERFFLDYSTSISKEQYDIVDKYWGISEIKTADVLYNHLSEGE